MRSIERTCIKTYGGGGNRPCHQFNAISIISRSEDPFIGVNFTCRLLFLHKYHFRLSVALRLVMLVTTVKVFNRPCGVFCMGLQAVETIQDQYRQYL